MRYVDAMKKALDERFTEGKILAYGQDVNLWGGAGGIFKDLVSKYPGSVIDTPISEMAVSNIAIGAAMTGIHGIVEFSFADFALHSVDQIINQAAKIPFMSNGQFSVPVMFRCNINSGRGYGATHSQSLEYMFMNIPGIHVVYPSDASDAYNLMRYCLDMNEPVVFFDHKLLHDIEDNEFLTNPSPTGSKIISYGNALTVVSYGRMLKEAKDVVSVIPDISLIDLRWLLPLDIDPIVDSVRSTRKLLVIEEGYGMVSAEVIARVTEAMQGQSFISHRLHSKYSPMPVNEAKEYEIITNIENIKSMIIKIL